MIYPHGFHIKIIALHHAHTFLCSHLIPATILPLLQNLQTIFLTGVYLHSSSPNMLSSSSSYSSSSSSNSSSESSDSSQKHKNAFSHFINSVSTYDTNVMLAGVISLLLVILFVLLLHIYAKWFLAQARRRRRPSSVYSVTQVLRPPRFHNFHTFHFDTALSTASKGLDTSVISSIPLFVYKVEEHKQGLECVICLSSFEENEVGRSLEKCGHVFHVECIDMWLHSHSSCPTCRAPAVGDNVVNDAKAMEVASEESAEEVGVVGVEVPRLEIVVDGPNSESLQTENLDTAAEASSASSSSSSSSSSLGCSLKRMLSRSRSESKVFPSSNVSALDL